MSSEPKQSDDDLVKKLVDHDDQALFVLIRRYGNFIQTVIWHYLRTPYERSYTNDILNRCYFQIWTKIHTFDAKKGSFKNWLSTVVKNQAFDYQRGLRGTFREMGLPDNILAAATMTDDSLDYDTLFAPLAQRDRRIFAMFFAEGYSAEEIAQQLHLSKANVYQRLSRGRQKIRQEVDRNEFIY